MNTLPDPAPEPSLDPSMQKDEVEQSHVPDSVAIIAHRSYPEDAVRVAAYHRYLRRLESGTAGNEVSDWVIAEKEVLGG